MTANSTTTSGSLLLRALLCVFLFIATGIAVICATSIGDRESRKAFGITSRPRKIGPWVMEHTANNKKAEFFVVLTDQADLNGAGALVTKAEKGRYVYD